MARVMTENQSLANINNQLWADDNFPSVSSDWTFKALNSMVKLTNILTPTLVNEFQFGYTNNFIHFQTSEESDPTLASRSGFTYTELFPQTSGSFPAVNGVDGFGSLAHQAPFTNREAFCNGRTLCRGHLGAIASKQDSSSDAGASANRQTEDLTIRPVSCLSTAFSDLLTGNLAQYQEEETLNPVYDRWHDYAIYLQDTWKATPHLTLDYGLRWQYLGQVFLRSQQHLQFLSKPI